MASLAALAAAGWCASAWAGPHEKAVQGDEALAPVVAPAEGGEVACQADEIDAAARKVKKPHPRSHHKPPKEHKPRNDHEPKPPRDIEEPNEKGPGEPKDPPPAASKPKDPKGDK